MRRWKKRLDQIMSWGRLDPANRLSPEQVDQWIRDERVRAMYPDESRAD